MDDGTHHHSKEADFGWSKPSLHWDLDHCLHTIIEGLDDHLKWLDKDHWWELASNYYPGIFQGCIGVGDIKELKVEKTKDPVKERRMRSVIKEIQ